MVTFEAIPYWGNISIINNQQRALIRLKFDILNIDDPDYRFVNNFFFVYSRAFIKTHTPDIICFIRCSLRQSTARKYIQNKQLIHR